MEARQHHDAEGMFTVVRRFRTNQDAPRAARALVHEFFAQLPYPDDERGDDVLLAVSELVSNAVLHGQAGEVTVRISALGSTSVRVEVSDAGEVPFDWPDGLTRRGHWGLGLVRLMSDRSGVDHSPNTLAWCEIALAG